MLRKTKLYKKDNVLLARKQIEDIIAIQNNYELPVTEGEMELIIIQNLAKNGGDILLIEDKILDWCNEYAVYREAEKHLNQEELDESILEYYTAITEKDEEFIEELINILKEDKDIQAVDFLKKLEELL